MSPKGTSRPRSDPAADLEPQRPGPQCVRTADMRAVWWQGPPTPWQNPWDTDVCWPGRAHPCSGRLTAVLGKRALPRPAPSLHLRSGGPGPSRHTCRSLQPARPPPAGRSLPVSRRLSRVPRAEKTQVAAACGTGTPTFPNFPLGLALFCFNRLKLEIKVKSESSFSLEETMFGFVSRIRVMTL